MTEEKKSLPLWILIVSGIIALLEVTVSLMLWFTPESVAETVDFSANGAHYLASMWAGRQFALGFIFAFSTFKKSVPMLMVCYIFFLVMFIGDLLVGISQKDNTLIGSAIVMCTISSAMIYVLDKKK